MENWKNKLYLGANLDILSESFSPKGYTGLSAFHKYWGKKPLEYLGFLIELLSKKGDIVLDPFLGSGLLARETASRSRRFIGIDINPISIELANLIIELPSPENLSKTFSELEASTKQIIEESYKLEDGRIATHYLWDNYDLKSIWIAGGRGFKRQELSPTEFDLKKFTEYENYESHNVRSLKLFQNSRINTSESIIVKDLFTGRALRNIDILIDCISEFPKSIQRPLLLALTSGSGQMSQMVFAITGRGKTKGKPNGRIEVGSWVIGYWRPPFHFEINVWNCYASRIRRLLKACKEFSHINSFSSTANISSLIEGNAIVSLINNDARKILDDIPTNSIALVITDPPHSDRIPYLELSELWNSILGKHPDFSQEIIISNAIGREKNREKYISDMSEIMINIFRVLKNGGYLAILFNSRDDKSWYYLSKSTTTSSSIKYCGCFPMNYSAGSVVQDNRSGSLKHDYVLIYQKSSCSEDNTQLPTEITTISGWSNGFPKNGED